jgi:hypothetical protein
MSVKDKERVDRHIDRRVVATAGEEMKLEESSQRVVGEKKEKMVIGWSAASFKGPR